MRSLLTRWVVVTFVLLAAAPLAALLTGVQPPPLEPGSAGGDPTAWLAWGVASSALIAAVLAGLAGRSAVGGWRLVAQLYAVAFGIGQLGGMIEAWFFHVLDGPTTGRILAMGALTSAAACTAAAWLTPPREADRAGLPLWRPSAGALLVTSALYVVAYFTAGEFVYPFVKAFYATRSLPPRLTIAAMQLFVRGPLFALIIYGVASTMRGSRTERALWAGAALSLVGGIAPLLMPNPYMPDAVRWAHMVEVSISNLVFGAVAGWILIGAGHPQGLKPRGHDQAFASSPPASAGG